MRLLLSLLLHLQVSRHPQRSTLFPYTTLFRSRERAEIEVDVDVDDAERDVEGLRRAIDSLGGAAGTAGRIGAIGGGIAVLGDRKSTRLNSSHVASSYAVSCLKKKKRK